MSGHAEQRLPSRAVVEKMLEDLLAERITREKAAEWARPFALGEIAEREDVKDIAAWDALSSLALCDLKQPETGKYMYDKISFRAWLEQLRAAPLKATDK